MAHKAIDMTKAQGNFTSSGSKAQTNYAAEVPKADQHTAATSPAAQNAYVASMTDPTILAHRLSGLKKKSSNQKWIDNAVKLGAPRLNTGIANAGPSWNSGFAPVATTIDTFPYKPKTNDAATNYDNNAKALGVKLQNEARARKAAP